MKKQVSVAAVAVFIASIAFAADPAVPGAKFEQLKAKHVQNLDANIRRDQDLKACYEKALNPADMQTCRGRAPKGNGAAGPKFAEHKAKVLQQIDNRIQQREERKACIAGAANHAAMKACPKMKGGR